MKERFRWHSSSGNDRKNPLNRRLVRELRSELPKYLVIFLFMTLTIGFVSGFLVACDSIVQAYEESFEKYRIEDGHFVLQEEVSATVLEKIEQKENVRICRDFYKEEPVGGGGTMRVFQMREEMNLACLMEGEFPEKEQEIAIDRMYAENNGIKPGDTLKIGEEDLVVSGLVALSDYSALFSDNHDLMFDAVKFGVAVVMRETYRKLPQEKEFYQYCWQYQDEPKDEKMERDLSEALIRTLMQEAFRAHVEVATVVPGYANQAICFTGKDLGSDRVMMVVLLYILIVILAFVFSVTIRHTIAKEAAVIGTLRALGYTKRELCGHYLAMPIAVTISSAVMGNVLGYTVFKDIAAQLYYNSYSLPTFQVLWNTEAFVLTTLVPVCVMLAVNLISLEGKLRLSPQRFLRRDLGKKTDRPALPLPAFPFFHRFRCRIILQNLPGYGTLFVGIFFSGFLLLLGMMMGPLLKNYQDKTVEGMIAKYQYVLETQIETENEQAEPFSMKSVTYEGKERSEEISVYGIVENSAYFTEELPEDGVCISDGFAEKYRIKAGDNIRLRETYGEEEYELTVKRIVDAPGSLAVFMKNRLYTEIFDVGTSLFDVGYTDIGLLLHRLATPDSGVYYNGYFSDEEITDIDEKYIAMCITEDDMTKVSRQLTVSMGEMFEILKIFATVMAALLVYLLTDLILDKNRTAISMVKILGYRDREIAGLYLVSTAVVVIGSVLITLLLATEGMRLIYKAFMSGFSGWLTCYFAPWIYPAMFLMLTAAYTAVALLQFRKIKKIPMDEALKNIE